MPTDVERVLDGVKPHLLRDRSSLWRRTTIRPGGSSCGDRVDGSGKGQGAQRRPRRLARGMGAVSRRRVYVWHGALHAAHGRRKPRGQRLCRPLADHLGQDPAGHRPRRLSLAARAGLVCRPEGQDGPLGGRSQADHGLGHPAPEVADRPRHREAGRMHEAADREQLLARPGGLRAVLADPAPPSSPPR